MVGGLGVGDGHKSLNPAGFRVFHREELLMFLHRGLQNLGRQVQEVIRDTAHQGHRPFDKARNLGQKAFVFHQFKAGGEGEVLRALPDRGLTLGRIQHHMGAFEFHRVVVKPGNSKAAGREEAVAFGGVRGGDAVDGEGDDGAAAFVRHEAQDRLQGAHPAQGARAPAHGLRPREAADGGFQHLGDDVGGGAAGLFDDGVKRFALFVGAAFELVERQAGGAQKALDGRLRGGGGGAFALFADGLGLRRKPVNRQGQTAGRREGAGGGIGKAGLDQSVGDQRFQILPRAGLHPGGDFFGKEFDQKVGHRFRSVRIWQRGKAGPSVALKRAGAKLVPGKSAAIGENRDHAVNIGGDVRLRQKGERLPVF